LSNYVTIGDRRIGPDYPPFLVAEIGINHSGSIDDALEMIHLAKMAGAEAVKFQKRTPRLCVPQSEWNKSRQTPWGEMSYIQYKERIEFDRFQYQQIADKCAEEYVMWFASVWDREALSFMRAFDPPCYKIGSASLTDEPLIAKVLDTGKPIILSTGMSTQEEIFRALHFCDEAADRIIICHSTSIYPCPPDKLNLRFIRTLQDWLPHLVIGYSGHERAARITQAAVALGASYIERHFTLDRRGWGTDQAASIEHGQFKDMADRIHETWQALGDGVKVVYPEEEEKKVTLRKVPVA
jgi:N-acetylneuraminate synthase